MVGPYPPHPSFRINYWTPTHPTPYFQKNCKVPSHPTPIGWGASPIGVGWDGENGVLYTPIFQVKMTVDARRNCWRAENDLCKVCVFCPYVFIQHPYVSIQYSTPSLPTPPQLEYIFWTPSLPQPIFSKNCRPLSTPSQFLIKSMDPYPPHPILLKIC